MPELLVGVDLRDGGADPVRIGKRLAEWLDFDLTLVHVLDRVPPEASVQVLQAKRPRVLDRLRDEAREAAVAQLKEWGEEWVNEVSLTVRVGRPAKELVALAAESEAATLVLGPGRKRTLGGLLGTTTDRVLRAGAVPVLVARGSSTEKPRTVLAAVDLSHSSPKVLREARRWADTLGASLIAFHVPQPRWRNAFLEGRDEHRLDEMFEEDEEMRTRAEAELQTLLTEEGMEGVRTETELAAPGADPAEEISARLDRGDVGILVMGTQSDFGLTRRILGSVAEALTRRSPVPVLVVPAS